MKKSILILILSFFSFLSFSQVTPSSGIAGSGTSGYIPRFTSSKKVGNSSIMNYSNGVTIFTSAFDAGSGNPNYQYSTSIGYLGIDYQSVSGSTIRFLQSTVVQGFITNTSGYTNIVSLNRIAFKSYTSGKSHLWMDATNGYIGIGEDYFTASYQFQVNGNSYFNNNLFSAIDVSSKVGIGTTSPTAKLQVVGLAEYADNAAAISAGLTVGAFYRTGDLLKVVH